MSQTAEKRNQEGFSKGPAASPADQDEGKVVIRAQNGMDQAQGGRGSGDDPDLMIEHAQKKMVDGRGFEPPTSALRTPRSPS